MRIRRIGFEPRFLQRDSIDENAKRLFLANHDRVSGFSLIRFI